MTTLAASKQTGGSIEVEQRLLKKVQLNMARPFKYRTDTGTVARHLFFSFFLNLHTVVSSIYILSVVTAR